MKIKLLFTLGILIWGSAIFAQDGEPDPTFGLSGKMITYFGSSQEEGVGFFNNNYMIGNTTVNGSKDFAISMASYDGFDNMGGRTTLDFGGEDCATAMAVVPGGRYIAGYTTNAGTTSIAIAKYQTNLDTGFGTGGTLIMSIGGVDDRASAAVALSNGKVLIGGYSTTASNKDFFLCLFNGNQLDTSFGTNGKVITDMGGQDIIKSIVITPEGKILVVGSSSNSGNSDVAMARYNLNGTLDTTFNTTGKVITAIGSGNDYANAVVLEANKYVVLGATHNGSNLDFSIIRYTTSGQIDTDYGNNGVITGSFGSGDDEATGGVIFGNTMIITGNTYNGNNKDVFIAKYGSSFNALEGQLIPEFGTNGKTVYNMGPGDDVSVGIVRLTDDGYFRVGGTTYNGHTNDILFAQFTAQGQPDDMFGHNGVGKVDFGNATNSFAYTMVKQPDNKVIIAGQTNVSGNDDFAMVRYNMDGSHDIDFGAAGKVITPISTGTDQIFAIDMQSDNKIVVCGPSNSTHIVARYNPNGTIDTSFGTNGIATITDWYHISALKVLADGKILLFGQRQVGTARTCKLMRLNNNGTVDTAFGGTSSGIVLMPYMPNAYGTSRAILVQPDNKIIVGAGSMAMAGYVVSRFNANGTADSSFGGGTGYTETALNGTIISLNSLGLQPDGKIIAVGAAGQGGDYATVLRYTIDGILDTSFSGNGIYSSGDLGMDPLSGDVVLQPDGKIIVALNVGLGRIKAFRIDEDGAYDDTFEEVSDIFTYNGSEATGFAGAELVNNMLVIGGFSFNNSSVHQCYGIARYNLGLPLSTEEFTDDSNRAKIIAYPNPVDTEVNIQVNFQSSEVISADLYDISGKKIATLLKGEQVNPGQVKTLILPETLAKGTYLISITSSKGSVSVKIVK